MAPRAALLLSGTVHGSRVVTYEGGTNKQGQKYDGGSYVELTLVTDQSILDREVSDVPATATIRMDSSEASRYGKGQVVDFLVTPFVDLVSIRGQWRSHVGYRLAADVTAAPSARAAS